MLRMIGIMWTDWYEGKGGRGSLLRIPPTGKRQPAKTLGIWGSFSVTSACGVQMTGCQVHGRLAGGGPVPG
eukprot:4474420-Pyramimonas_sp.AAC.1